MFHVNWNIVPYHPEQYSTLALTRHLTLKRNEGNGKSSSKTIKNKKHEMINRQFKMNTKNAQF
ncbi:hypothetical protein HMPREF6745_2357 [Prevotella sp. oral taxon 472 str. F0295]|nr:hypothetical protein HMPREF6745_2357 [Prevotella sp. oral taxon 472 str. F0295]